MNIFKDRIVPWWEIGLIKWSTFFIGIAIGAYWSDIFKPFVFVLTVTGTVMALIAGYFWSKE